MRECSFGCYSLCRSVVNYTARPAARPAETLIPYTVCQPELSTRPTLLKSRLSKTAIRFVVAGERSGLKLVMAAVG